LDEHSSLQALEYFANDGLYVVLLIGIDVVFHSLDVADDEEDYDEANGGNRLLGFMFGNVDNSGELDVDYLDEVMIHALFMLCLKKSSFCGSDAYRGCSTVRADFNECIYYLHLDLLSECPCEEK